MASRNRSYEIRLDGKLATRTLKELDKEASRLRNVLRNMSTESKNYGKTVKSYERVKQAQQENYQQIRKVDRATRRAAQTNQSFASKARGMFRGLQRNWFAITAAVTGFIFAFRGTFNVISDFDQATANLASILAKTREEISALTENAKELGSTTAFTASEVQNLQIELAKLGFQDNQILEMTESIVNFSVVTKSEVPEAAALAGGAIRQFNLRASESERVVSALSVATTKSALDFSKLQTALPIVGSVAANANRTLEETLGLLGVLVDRGLDASIAGTSLRNIFLETAKRGIELNEAFEQINNATDKNVKSLELFGKRGAVAGVILAENSTQADNLAESLIDVNEQMQEMAEKQLQTLNGRLKLLKSAWEGFILSIEDGEGTLGGAFKTAIDAAADLLNTLSNLEGAFGYTQIVLGLKSVQNASVETLDFILKSGVTDTGTRVADIVRTVKNSIDQLTAKQVRDNIDHFSIQFVTGMTEAGESAQDAFILWERLKESILEANEGKLIQQAAEDLKLLVEEHGSLNDEVQNALLQEYSWNTIEKAVEQYKKELNRAKTSVEDLNEEAGDTSDEIEAQAGSIAWLKQQISELKELIENSNDPNQIVIWKEEMMRFQEELEIAEGILQRIDDMIKLQSAVRQGLTFGEEVDPLPDRSGEFLQGSEPAPTTDFQNLAEAQLLQSLQDQKITYEQFLVELNELRLRAEIKHWEEKMATLDEKSKEYLELQRKVAENEVELQRNTTDQITADRERMHDVLISGLSHIGEVTGQFLVDQHQSAEDFQKNLLLSLLDFISNSVLAYIPLILAKEVAEKSFAGIATATILGGVLKGALETMKNRIRSEQSSSGLQGYEEGGDTPSRGVYRDQSGKEVTGVVHTDEWIAPEWMNKHPKISPTIRALETIRQRGSFAEGGFAGTSPSFPDNITFGPAPAQDNSDILNELRGLRADQNRQQKNIRAFVVLRDIENSQNELNSIINNASI